MLDKFRRGQRWLTAIFVAVIGVVFIFFIGLGGPLESQTPAGSAVVQLGELRLEVPDFERVRLQQENRFREQLGDQFDAKSAQAFLDSQALRILVDSAVLTHEAEALGLQASKNEIQDNLRNDPSLRDPDGKFVKEAFENWVRFTYGSQRAFLEVMRQEILRQKMAQLLWSQAQVSTGEARTAALHLLEEAQIAFVALDTAQLPPGMEINDDDAQMYLDAHTAEVRADYDARISEFALPERVRARHILFRIEEDASDEEIAVVQVRAGEALTRLAEGANFAELASELSEDPGSAENGGDLGVFARGERSSALSDAAFGLEVGATSEIVRGEAGLHIVQLEERLPTGQVPFEEARLDIARAMATAAKARDRANSLAEQLSAAVRDGASLEDAARDADLTLVRTDMLKRRPDGFIEGLGASPEILATAFALDPENGSSPRVFSLDTRLILIQLMDRNTPTDVEIEDEALVQLDILTGQKRNTILQGWVDARRTELAESRQLLVNSSIITGS